MSGFAAPRRSRVGDGGHLYVQEEYAMQNPMWRVRVMRDVTEFGVVSIEAESAEQAIEQAIEMFSNDLDGRLLTDHETGLVSVTQVERVEGDL